MLFLVIYISLTCIIFVGGPLGINANAATVKRGDRCTIAGQIGQWTDNTECRTAHEFVHISSALLPFVDDFDLFVCCEIHHIVDECPESDVNFELSRNEQNVVLRKVCGRPLPPAVHKQNEGDACSINDKTGSWTYTSYCELYANTVDGSTSGCCKLVNVRTQKCQEYVGVAGCDRPLDNFDTPFMVEMFYHNKKTAIDCAGVLVSERYVLGTGWCLQGGSVSFVKIGTRNPTPFVEVAATILHDKYNYRFMVVWNDIGLLRLRTAIALSVNVHPVCLPHHDMIGRKTVELVAFELRESTTIRRTVSLMRMSKCKNFWSYIEEQHICGSRAPCDGAMIKWGAPIFVRNSSSSCTAVLMGVASNERDDWYELLFTRIFHYVEWIERIVWQ